MKKYIPIRFLIPTIIFFIALIPVYLGIFHSGFFVSDDGNWMIVRLSAFYEALRQGQFPVRYLPRLNNGYGYPVEDFLYPLFLYLGSVIHIFHINFILTIKILFALSLFASLVGSFLWLRKLYGTVAGYVGALLYTLFPYHIWDITKRGSLGEVLAMGVAPFIFWQIEKGNIFFTSLGITLLIVSHNTLAALFLSIIVGYMLLNKRVGLCIFSLILGLGASVFFWFPALFDLQYTAFSKTSVANFPQYFLSLQLYPLIGIVSLVVILLASSLRKISKDFIFFFLITLLSIIFSTRISLPFWQILHLGNYVQFPFRFLSLTTLGVGFLASFTIANWQKKYIGMIASILVVLLYISSWQYFFPKMYQQYPDTYYSTNEDSTTVQNEYMPVSVRKAYASSQRMVVSGVTNVARLSDKGSSLSFVAEVSKPTRVTIGKIYFPGWAVLVDTHMQSIQTNDYGFITFILPQGRHTVIAKFGETTARSVADLISALAFGILLVGLVIQLRNEAFATYTKK